MRKADPTNKVRRCCLKGCCRLDSDALSIRALTRALCVQALIFSQFNSTLDWLKLALARHGFGYRTIDGSMARAGPPAAERRRRLCRRRRSCSRPFFLPHARA